MKVRNGFVSNSSSSSFIVNYTEENIKFLKEIEVSFVKINNKLYTEFIHDNYETYDLFREHFGYDDVLGYLDGHTDEEYTSINNVPLLNKDFEININIIERKD